MLNRRTVIAACLTSSLMLAASPANAAAYFIAGKWYYFSLNFESLLARITGKDLKDGTFVGAEVKILESDVQCGNPQGQLIAPGQGPQGVAYGTSPNVNGNDLTKANDKVQGNVYTTTAKIVNLVPEAQRLNPPSDLCKNAPGVSSWQPVFWQDRNCSKGLPAAQLTAPVCYRELAVMKDGVLTYITGASSGSPVPPAMVGDWTFLYLPKVFRFKATLQNSAAGAYDVLYGSCAFPANNEPGAAYPGQPYSIANPPVNGWAAAPAITFTCVGINANEY